MYIFRYEVNLYIILVDLNSFNYEMKKKLKNIIITFIIFNIYINYRGY